MSSVNKKGLPKMAPDIRLFGKIDEQMLGEFFRQQAELPGGKPVVMEISTSGGDADVVADG